MWYCPSFSMMELWCTFHGTLVRCLVWNFVVGYCIPCHYGKTVKCRCFAKYGILKSLLDNIVHQNSSFFLRYILMEKENNFFYLHSASRFLFFADLETSTQEQSDCTTSCNDDFNDSWIYVTTKKGKTYMYLEDFLRTSCYIYLWILIMPAVTYIY